VRELGLPDVSALTGAVLDTLDDARWPPRSRAPGCSRRSAPEHKARIVRVHRRAGAGGVALRRRRHDALAPHATDVGITVDSATDVARTPPT
jgi:P-type Mg2+ transporter